MGKINIIRQAQSIHVQKDNKTLVDYFLFDEYEIHYNIIPPNCVQEWHYHAKIEEAILVTKGTLEVYWKGKETYHQTLLAGDLVQVKDAMHTFCNESKKTAEFIVFRLVLDGKSKKDIIKHDKILEKNTR